MRLLSSVFVIILLIIEAKLVKSDDPEEENRIPTLDDGSEVKIAVQSKNFVPNGIYFNQDYEMLGGVDVKIQIINLLDKFDGENYIYYLQIHSLFYKLSFQRVDLKEKSKLSTNLGTIFEYGNQTNFILRNYHPNTTVHLIIVLLVYSKNLVPIPGGCATLKRLAEPNLKIVLKEDTVSVKTEMASMNGSCPKDIEINYDHRYIYLGKNDFSDSSYFEAIKKLITGKSALEWGTSLEGRADSWHKFRKLYSRYAGMGLFFTTVITFENQSSPIPISYVPGHTYGCEYDMEPKCDLIENAEAKFMYIILFLVGLAKLIFGRGLLFLRTLVYSFIIGGFVAYFICAKIEQETLKLGLMITGGFLFAVTWAIIWLRCDSVYRISDLMAAIILGYIFSCLLIFSTADAEFLIPTVNYYFLIVFGIIFVIVMYFSIITIYSVILINAMVGATFVVLTMLFIFDGNLQYAFVNNWRRIQSEDYRFALCFPHFEVVDWICVTLWLVILSLGIVIQKKYLVQYFAYGILQNENFCRAPRPTYRLFRDPEQEPLIAQQNLSHSSDDVFLSPRSNTRYLASINRNQI